MKKEKIKCDFGIKQFHLGKRSKTEVERAPRPGSGGSQNGKGKNKPDSTPPVISNIVVGTFVNSSLQITWATNEECTSSLEYGTTTSYGNTIASTGSTSHSAMLTSLVQGGTYNFRITARDLAGNVTVSANQTFVAGTGGGGAADNVLYLEFYGATISGTMWNTSGSIIAAHSGLSTIEVTDVIDRVKSHFAQFNILVTDDINIYNSTPYNKKARVIFTESWEWYGQAGGVAYVNSFGWGDQSPAWVFTSLLAYNTHNIGEAGAHETGHMLGCRHQVTCQDGVKTSEYNWGDGVTAPVMGASYNVASGDWWIGPNSLGCSVIQDDTAIITAKIGLA